MMKITKIRFRICKIKSCGKKYEVNPKYPLFPCCSANCAYEYQKVLRANKLAKENKEERKELSELKKSILTHKDWIKMCQTVFNAFIRERDKNLPCISCGVTKCEEFHAGHYIATTYQYLRFNENNVWKQCSKCNTHLRGNSIPYRIELIKRIGLEEVEVLENTRHMMLEISIPEIKEKIKEYKLKLKTIKNG